MCTFLLYHDPDSSQPFTMASTRDEAINRKTLFPSEVNWGGHKAYNHCHDYPIDRDSNSQSRLHLNFLKGEINPSEPFRPSQLQRFADYTDAGIQGPQDTQVGGMFAGTNKYGLIAAMNNLEVNLDVKNKLARGGLVLDALTFNSAQAAANAIYKKLIDIQCNGLKWHDGTEHRYPAFNLIIADKDGAYVVQSGPKSILRENIIIADDFESPHSHKMPTIPDTLRVAPGKITSFQNKNRKLTIRGSTINKDTIVVSCERIPPKMPVIICGWSVNDRERSKRTDIFLDRMERSITKNGLPQTHKPETWGYWLFHMRDRSGKKEEKESVQAKSITQPIIEITDRINPNKKIQWGTIGTSLFSITKSGNAPVAEMYYSPSPPTMDHPMEFQHIRSDTPDRQGTQARNVVFIPEERPDSTPQNRHYSFTINRLYESRLPKSYVPCDVPVTARVSADSFIGRMVSRVLPPPDRTLP